MPTERPTIASCPHCRAILLRTERALIHPTGIEREEIERALGDYWFEHSNSRFDGRYHRCLGREPIVFTSNPSHDRRSTDESREGHDSGHAPYRGPHRDLRVSSQFRRSLLVAAICAGLAAISSAQEPRPLLIETHRADPTPTHQLAAPQSPASDVPRILDHFLTTQSKGGRPIADEHVVLSRGAAEAGNAPGLPPPLAGQPMRSGSWQGMVLASGRYQIFDILRVASAGVVYLAHDRNLDADVVVEVPALPPVQDSESTARFMRAVRSLASLVHPHLVKVTEVGTHDDAPFVVAEHRAGGSLKFRRPVGPDGRPSPVSPRSLEQWLPDVSDALDFLHTRDRIYREVSPANILFDDNGHASLGGVGIAQASAEWLRPASRGVPTTAGRRLAGPSPILAPEIVEGGPADGRADQFALAATVYELLCGHSPFEGRELAEVFVKGSITEPPELCRICPSISEALSSAVHRGLSQDPGCRFPDCKAFARAVVSAAREPSPTVVAVNMPAIVGRTSEFDLRGMLSGLPKIDRRGRSATTQVALGMASCVLIGVLGAAASRLRSRRTVTDEAVSPRQAAGHPVHELRRLPGSFHLDGMPRSLPNSSKRQDAGTRVLEIRRHASELAGRSHLPQVPALLSSGAVGTELLPLPNLDPVADRPKTRLADNLLPVVSPNPGQIRSLPQEPGPKPLALDHRRAS
jgi:serine/threonine protein kinase